MIKKAKGTKKLKGEAKGTRLKKAKGIKRLKGQDEKG